MRKFLAICFWSLCIASTADAQTVHNLTLEQALEYAVENNVEVREAALNIEKAEEQVWESTSTGLPQINGNIDYNYNIQRQVFVFPDSAGVNRPVEIGNRNDISAGATLSQLLFSGSYLVGLQSAKAFKEITILQKEKTEAVLKEQVANAYSAVLISDETVAILNKDLTVSNKNLNDTRETYKQGLTEEQNVDQLEYNNKTLISGLNIAKRQREASLNTLKFIIGIPQEDELNLITDIDDIITQSLIDTGSNTVDNHIDFRLAENNVLINELQVKYQKSFALPTLSAFLNTSYNAFSDDFFDFFNNRWYNATVAGAKLEIPIFSSFGRRSRTEQAKIDLEVAKLQLYNTEQEILNNVLNANLEYQNAIDNYETTKELVALSDKIYGKERIKFFEGLSSSLDLNEAEDQLYNSQNQYIQSIFEVIQARNNLLQALGKY